MIKQPLNWKSITTQHVPAVQPCDLKWRRRWLGYRYYWHWQLGGWGLLLLSQIPSIITPFDSLTGGAALTALIFVSASLLCSHFIRGILIGLRSRALTWRSMLLRLLPWIVIFSVVDGSLLSLMGVHFLPTEFTYPYLKQTPTEQFLTNLVYSANYTFIVLVVWVFCYLLYHLYVAYQHAQLERLRLEVTIRESELRHLRSQMDPHFLFNSLNTVRALISPKNQ